MNQLLKSLGYTGDGEPEDSKSPSTQPTGP
jgi:hypothetical protein